MPDRVRRAGGGKYHNGLVGPGETITQRPADSLRFRDRRRTQNDGNRIVGRAFEHAVDYIAKVLGFHAREGNVDGVSIQHRIGNIQSL